jgi:hypothetical protein
MVCAHRSGRSRIRRIPSTPSQAPAGCAAADATRRDRAPRTITHQQCERPDRGLVRLEVAPRRKPRRPDPRSSAASPSQRLPARAHGRTLNPPQHSANSRPRSGCRFDVSRPEPLSIPEPPIPFFCFRRNRDDRGVPRPSPARLRRSLRSLRHPVRRLAARAVGGVLMCAALATVLVGATLAATGARQARTVLLTAAIAGFVTAMPIWLPAGIVIGAAASWPRALPRARSRVANSPQRVASRVVASAG